MQRMTGICVLAYFLVAALPGDAFAGFGRLGKSYNPSPPAPQPTVTAAPVESLPPDPGIAEGKFMLLTKGGMRVSGMPSTITALPVEAPFGRTEVPLSLIASAQFGAAPQSARITFRNGDTLTVQVRLEKLTLSTSYGEVTVPTADIARFAAGSRFPTDNLSAAEVASPPSGAAGELDARQRESRAKLEHEEAIRAKRLLLESLPQ